MSRTQKILLIAFVVLVAGLVYLEATKPQPINWFASYAKTDKIPYGTYVLHNLMQEAFKSHFIESNRPPFEVLKDKELSGNYFFVNNVISFDNVEQDSLLNWVAKGNNLFIGANYISNDLVDSLGLTLRTLSKASKLTTEPLLKLSNPSLKPPRIYHIKKPLDLRYFYKVDTLNHIALGVSDIYHKGLKMDDPEINFIQVPFEKGNIFLHLQSEIFTNYFLLEDDNYKYTQNVLSYINDGRPVIWDNYYKSGKSYEVSPLHVLFKNRYLKTAYYLVLIGILLYILFEGKRKQRSIPIITPVTNRSVEYAKTVSGMFWDRKEYRAIAEKQVLIFLEYIRSHLRIPTDRQNEQFFKDLAARSGNSLEVTKHLFNKIMKLKTATIYSRQELESLYRDIEEFKKAADRLKTEPKSEP